MTSRTQDEIIAKISEVEPDDWMGTIKSDLVEFLDYEHAKPYLKDDVTAAECSESVKDVKKPSLQIKDYMPFAFNKANNCRGLSAGRSLDHMYAWLWLDGQDEFLTANDIRDYQYYGKDELVKICELYGLDATQWDDGCRVNSEDEL